MLKTIGMQPTQFEHSSFAYKTKYKFESQMNLQVAFQNDPALAFMNCNQLFFCFLVTTTAIVAGADTAAFLV